MNILLTNDDGIHGEGLNVLKCALLKKHAVIVIAPDRNRSAVSNGLNLTEQLAIQKISATEYAYAGLPADCVNAGILNYRFFCGGIKPDVVISGINRGANLGTDTVYSGTVAAARQASLMAIPGIAVSLAADESPRSDGTWQYEPLAAFVADNIEHLVSYTTAHSFLNINAGGGTPYKGVCFTVLARRDYHDDVQVTHDAHADKWYGTFCGGTVTSEPEIFRNAPPEETLTDTQAVRCCNISISCIYDHPESFIPSVLHHNDFIL